MRVTNQMIMDHSTRSMSNSLSTLYDYQKKAAANKQFLNASDDPAAAATVFTLKSTLATSEVYLSSADSTMEWMSANDFALANGQDIATKAIALITRGLSDTSGSDARKAIADEVNGLINQTIDLANSKHLNRYVFAGFSTDTPPFTAIPDAVNPDPTRAVDVRYKDGTPAAQAFQAIQREIGPGETITANIDGYATFNNLIHSLIATRDSLEANDMTALRLQRTAMEGALNDVTHSSTTNGARMRNLEQTTSRIEQNNTDLTALMATKEQANMPEILSQLKNQETTYNLVVQIASRTQSMMNLFDAL
jgi:flagellar hook-associated protein 3 FlgL